MVNFMKKILIFAALIALSADLYSAAGTSGRKIAVLAYGSVINNPSDMLISGHFQKAPIYMPIRMSRASRWPGFPDPSGMTAERRFSLTIDPNATPEAVYFARSKFTSLPAARDDLAKREGAPNRNNIAYLRRLQCRQSPDDNENYRKESWTGYLLQLPPKYADVIVEWAEQAGFDAVIWASLPANVPTGTGPLAGRAILDYFYHDPVLLRNTQAYINGLPEDIKTPLLRTIETGSFLLPAAGSSSSTHLAAPAEVVPAPSDIVDTTYMYAHRGNLPVLLTAPHGGRVKIPGVNRRTHPSACFAWDHNSDILTNEISRELKQMLGAEPYVVVAKFHRDQIDGNRSPGEAYEDARAKPVYDAFQNQINEYLQEMLQRYGSNIIHFDIHGQAVDSKTIYRGTRNRSLVRPLLESKGEEAFTGPHSVLGYLEHNGYTIYPANNQPNKNEYRLFTGGYIVGHYSKKFGIPSIQLETGGWHRNVDNIPQVAKDIARAIVEFLNYYGYLQ